MPNDLTNLAKLMDDVADVMTPEDVSEAIHYINRYFGDLAGSRLEAKVRTVADKVRRFHNPPKFGGPAQEANWVAMGLLYVTGDELDLVDTRKCPSRQALREQYDIRVAEAEEEALHDETYTSPYNDEEKRVVYAWLDASPYVVWRMYSDALQKARMELEDRLFDFINDDDNLSSLQHDLQKNFRATAWDWRENLLAKKENVA